ncbi:hypothetical protein D3C71_1594780 [compost metagenome]
MLMIAPPSAWACITWLTCWQRFSGAIRFRRMIASLKRDEAVAASAFGEPPALLTNTSRRPKRSTMCAIKRPDCSTSRRSQGRNSASRPALAGKVCGASRPQITTSAPQSRKRWLIPRPTPLPPPVTSTTLPRKSIGSSMGILFLSLGNAVDARSVVPVIQRPMRLGTV